MSIDPSRPPGETPDPGRGETRIVDVHAHHVPLALVEEIGRNGNTYGASVKKADDGRYQLVFVDGPAIRPFYNELLDLSGRRAHLARAGIDVQVISSWADIAGYHLPAQQAIAWTRLQNETLADAVRADDSRFAAMGALPMQDVRQAMAEMRFAAEHLNMRAFQICTSVEGRDLDTAGFRPFWRLACDMGCLIFLHPPVRQIGAERLGDYFLTNLLGNPMETTVAAARLIFSGIFQELPELKILLAHGGGMLPYQIGRLDRGFMANPATRVHLRHKPSEFLGSFYYDTVLFDDTVLNHLLRMVPPDRVMLGTDFPFPIRDDDMLKRLQRQRHIQPHDMSEVLGGNARRLGLL
jgi:aminocarboxymuconate-semialdehyde decarboxylase